MRPIRSLAFLLAVFLAVHSIGCSMMTLKPLPGDYKPSEPPDCGHSWGLIPDTLFAAYSVMGLATLVLVGGCQSSGAVGAVGAFDPSNVCFGATLLFSALSALFVGSTITGLIWAKKCRQATDSHEAWLEMESGK